jgi:hypothetical protein
MARGFVRGNRRQSTLLPPSIEEWIPKNHPVRFVGECVRQMNLLSFHAEYGRGVLPMIQR